MSADVHSLIGAYALDAVDDEERRLVDAHLTECATCAQEAAELREAVWRLSDVTTAEAPPRLRERVLAEAHRTRQEAPTARESDDEAPVDGAGSRRVPRLRRAFALAAAVVLIAFAGGVLTWAVMQQFAETGMSEGEQMAAVLEAADAEVAVQEAEGGGQVTVVQSASLDRAVVVLSDLAQVTAERSYQLWLVDESGAASAGVLEAGDSSATVLVDGITDAQILGVTNEPAGGSDTPTLPMVAGVELSA